MNEHGMNYLGLMCIICISPVRNDESQYNSCRPKYTLLYKDSRSTIFDEKYHCNFFIFYASLLKRLVCYIFCVLTRPHLLVPA